MPQHPITTDRETQTGDRIYEAVFEASLDFNIEMTLDTAKQFFRRIDSYNDFAAESVISALDTIGALIPRTHYGEGNPNNGARDFNVSVAREGSPVISLERIEWLGRERMSNELLRQVCRTMQVDASADEADFDISPFSTEGRKIVFRFWWD